MLFTAAGAVILHAGASGAGGACVLRARTREPPGRAFPSFCSMPQGGAGRSRRTGRLRGSEPARRPVWPSPLDTTERSFVQIRQKRPEYGILPRSGRT